MSAVVLNASGRPYSASRQISGGRVLSRNAPSRSSGTQSFSGSMMSICAQVPIVSWAKMNRSGPRPRGTTICTLSLNASKGTARALTVMLVPSALKASTTCFIASFSEAR